MARAAELGLHAQVHYVGLAPADLMAGLYAGASAMVMPTFHGPTNLPVIEAWAAGCPVLTSRIRGIAEHVGSAGLLADPNSTGEVAEGIRRLWLDEALASTLVREGRRRLSEHSVDGFRQRLCEILDDARTSARSNGSQFTK